MPTTSALASGQAWAKTILILMRSFPNQGERQHYQMKSLQQNARPKGSDHQIRFFKEVP